jgi:hypothetical protein
MYQPTIYTPEGEVVDNEIVWISRVDDLFDNSDPQNIVDLKDHLTAEGYSNELIALRFNAQHGPNPIYMTDTPATRLLVSFSCEVCFVKEITTVPAAIVDQLGVVLGTPSSNTYYELTAPAGGQATFAIMNAASTLSTLV